MRSWRGNCRWRESLPQPARPVQRATAQPSHRPVRARSEQSGPLRTPPPKRATNGSPSANLRSSTAPATRSTQSEAAGRRNPTPDAGCTPDNTTRRVSSRIADRSITRPESYTRRGPEPLLQLPREDAPKWMKDSWDAKLILQVDRITRAPI